MSLMYAVLLLLLQHCPQIKPKSPPDICQEDLSVSGMSGIFFSMLSDVKQFYDYNYREVCAVLCLV